MNSSAIFYKFKLQSTVVVEARESDRNTDNGGDGSLILFG